MLKSFNFFVRERVLQKPPPPPVLIDSNGGIEVALLYVKA